MKRNNTPIIIAVLLVFLSCCCVIACVSAVSSALLLNRSKVPMPPVLPTQTGSADLAAAWQQNIDDLYAFYAQYPASTKIMEGELPQPALPIMGVFEVLDRLTMQEGWVLDYVYHADGMGSFPILYARPEGQAPYANEDELQRAEERCAAQSGTAGCPAYLAYVIPDGSPLSYLQKALLANSGGQFYLGWHALYNDALPFATQAELDRIADELLNESFGAPLSRADAAKARRLNIQPRVSIEGEHVKLRYLIFTKWGGFIEKNLELDAQNPAYWSAGPDNVLLPYASGIMF